CPRRGVRHPRGIPDRGRTSAAMVFGHGLGGVEGGGDPGRLDVGLTTLDATFFLCQVFLGDVELPVAGTQDERLPLGGGEEQGALLRRLAVTYRAEPVVELGDLDD